MNLKCWNLWQGYGNCCGMEWGWETGVREWVVMGMNHQTRAELYFPVCHVKIVAEFSVPVDIDFYFDEFAMLYKFHDYLLTLDLYGCGCYLHQAVEFMSSWLTLNREFDNHLDDRVFPNSDSLLIQWICGDNKLTCDIVAVTFQPCLFTAVLCHCCLSILEHCSGMMKSFLCSIHKKKA